MSTDVKCPQCGVSTQIEIEITEEMARAGADVIRRSVEDIREGWLTALEVAPLVWSAMMRCADTPG